MRQRLVAGKLLACGARCGKQSLCWQDCWRPSNDYLYWVTANHTGTQGHTRPSEPLSWP